MPALRQQVLKIQTVGDAILPGPKEEIEELREKFKKAKEGLRDAMYNGTWERVVDESKSIV